MTGWTLVRRSLRFYWRTHLGVVLGAAVASAALVGALVVGDSVRGSLRALALARLGRTVLALAPQERSVRAGLADDLASDLRAPVAPVLQLRALAANSDGSARANRVQVLGVDPRFFALSGGGHPPYGGRKGIPEDGVVLNERLAAQLRVKTGDEIVLRIEKPSLLPRGAPLSSEEDASIALRLTVAAIASDDEFGRFSLQANQVPPYNAFVSLSRLQREVEQAGRANLLLVGEAEPGSPSLDKARAALAKVWRLADAELELRDLPAQGCRELRSHRVFLDPAVVGAVARVGDGEIAVLAYFVNELRVGSRTAPYSMAAGISDLRVPMAEHRPSAIGAASPLAGLKDDEAAISSWLADDLQAKPGDMLEMSYYVLGTGRRLETLRSTFRIRQVLPMTGLAADRELMPDFPGIADVENCRDWHPGIPIDLKKVRKSDEEYWAKHRGTPKVFLNLAAAQAMWGNRFGNLTAIRWPLRQTSEISETSEVSKASVDAAIRRELNPASVGLFLQPVREQALAATRQGTDFGQLFLGFSFFLIAAALILMGLLFAFGIEQRTEEVGTLLALGFPPRQVRRLMLFEGGALALAGGGVGAGCGTLYTRAVLYGLSTVWQGAAGGASLTFHAEVSTILLGWVAAVVAAVVAMGLVLWRQGRRPARELLAGPGIADSRFSIADFKQARMKGLPFLRSAIRNPQSAICLAAGLAAVALVAWAGARRDPTAAGAFFAAGALLLIAGLAASHALLSRLAGLTSKVSETSEVLTLGGLGVRNAARRRGRSLAVIGLLACGSFLVVAVGANRHNPAAEARERSSGTGGFVLYGESALPIYQDLNSPEGRRAFGLDATTMEGVSIVALRVHEGDDASCLNLNRAQRPRLLGVRPEALQSRGAFRFERADRRAGRGGGWERLDRGLASEREVRGSEESRVPGGPPDQSAIRNPQSAIGPPVLAIADENTATWGLGLSVGGTLSYPDERGASFPLGLAAVIGNSVLQGSLLISERDFIARFPSESGFRAFLIDAPPERAEAVSEELMRALQDVGLELTPTARRLAEFNEVENTYLSIFQALGGLGLLLGSVGLGIVVLRNVLERRGELALLRAVGFRRRALGWLVLAEHWGLLLLGVGCGVVAAIVAVVPALRSPGAGVPYASLSATLIAVVASGLLWTWLAAAVALRGPLLPALRDE